MVVLCRAWRGLTLWLLLAVALLTACSPPAPRDDFAYARTSFSLTVKGTYLPESDPDGTPRPFAATVTAGAPTAGEEPAARDLTVTFTEPASLQGVTVTARMTPASDGSPPSGAVTRSVVFAYPSDHGVVEVTAKGAEFDGLLRYAEALFPIGDIVEVSPRAEDGSHTVTRRTADGNREAVFTFAEGRVYPVEVALKDGRGILRMRVESS